MLLRGCWVLLLLPLLPLLCTPAAGLLSWLGLGAAPQEEVAVVTPQALQPSGPPPVPFEMTLGDERFLAEAERWDPSPLDSCQHQVVAQLRSSCADLSEEEVAKLGVALFNCQASAEGRRTYPCGLDVPLERCTAAMDPDTWTAYHVVSNRARAVCYAARQLEFRRRTERAVAALAAAAASQLEAMRALKEEQAALRELTAESLQRALSGQRELLAQQERLRGSQGQMETSIHSSLEQLAQEKALLATWQHHIAQLVEGITEKMENMSHHLAVQDEGLQEGHRTVLTDLSRAQERAQDVYSKIESHLVLFLAYQNRTARGYDEVVGKLQRMNQSLELALAAVDSLRSQLESWLQHIRAVLSWAGLGPSAASTCILHGAYFLLLALLLAFLQAPALPRAALLLLVISNAAHQLRGAGSLGFPALSALLGLVAAGHRLLAATRCRAAGAPLPALSLGAGQPHCHLTSTPERYEASFSRGGFETCPLRDRLELSYLQERCFKPFIGSSGSQG
ncbi:protein brambleberry-like [Rhea pennata]|uniref:protein brambleberry-like n=1 Tax=Rhea pennata TaxID=8795 RepID=UPI002E261CC8